MSNNQANSVIDRSIPKTSNALTTARMKQFNGWMRELGIKNRRSLTPNALEELSKRCENNGQRRALHCHLKLGLRVSLDISDDGSRIAFKGEGARNPFVVPATPAEVSTR